MAAGPKHRVLREVEILARVHTSMAIETLALIAGMREETGFDVVPAQARVAAANALLDRGWGKPSQTIAIDPRDDHMTDEELARHVEQRIAVLAAAAGVGPRGPGPGQAPAGAEEAQGQVFAPRVVH